MERYNLIKKGIVVAVIFLFIGLAFAPSINANINKESNLVEITTEVCGIDGVKPHSVKLTTEEASKVGALFDSIKERLDGAESREETVEIFNEALLELNEYSLFYEKTSAEQVQSLITSDKDYLIEGNTTRTNFFEPFSGLLYISGRLLRFIFNILGIEFGELITFGYTTRGAYANMYPSEGVVHIDGPTGVTNFTGEIYGRIRTYFGDNYYHLGVKGFNGIKINHENGFTYFLGSALKVDIGYDF